MLDLSIRSLGKKNRSFIIFPVFILFLLSITLTLSRAIRYRSWEVSLRWWHWIGFIIWIISYIFLFSTIRKLYPNKQFILFSSIELLTGIGLLTIFRLNNFFGLRQSLWLIICTLVVIFLLKNRGFLETVKQYKYLLLISGLVLIVLTFLFGTYPGGVGPKLWLGLRGIYFQPSELLKIILIIYLAAYFSEIPIIRKNIPKTIFPTAILTFATIALLIFQRDLGTALIFLSIYILIIFSVFGKRRILLVSFILLLIIAIAGYYTIDLIRIRFQGWVFPWSDPQTGSYQIVQSIIAIAAGGLFGTGIGLGYPYLVPLAHSDFIFSAIGEELGLVGAIGILCLLAVILFQGINISIKAKNKFHRYLAIGITSYLITQSILIIGGNVRLLPITGVTLPFVSYGGSSLLVSFIAFSILLMVEGEQKREVSHVERKPYRIVALFFSACIFAIALTLGWWGIINANDLQMREDNARNLIANLFVKRGEIIDRNNTILAQSIGKPGEIERIYSYPPLSNTVGFFHQKYGLSGIEAYSDDYLRGNRGYPSQDIWFSYLLYDQPPEGRPIRLTIDSILQQKSDQLLQGSIGGMVILDSENGEILSISTFPFFNANQLDENWEVWQNDPTLPLINRATQSAYPVGGLISPLILAYDNDELSDALLPNGLNSYDRIDQYCSRGEKNETNMLKYGCVGTALNFGENISPAVLFANYPLKALKTQTDIGLPLNPQPEIAPEKTWVDLFFGSDVLRSNPLQVATAFLPLNNQGQMVNPSIVSAVQTANAGWVFISDPQIRQVFTEDKANEISSQLKSEDIDFWEISAATQDENNQYYWYVAGFNEDQSSKKPFILSLVLESASREKVLEVGRQMMQFMLE